MTPVAVTCLLAVLGTLSVGVASADTTPPPGCRPGLVVDCAFQYENLVWSKDEQNECRPILNECFFNQANCVRYRQSRPFLQRITKEECQTLCVNDCSQAPQNTICAHRGEKYCTFPSQCEWSKHLCNTAEYWYQEGPAPCGPNPVPCFA